MPPTQGIEDWIYGGLPQITIKPQLKRKNKQMSGLGWGELSWPESESARNFVDENVYEKCSATFFIFF